MSIHADGPGTHSALIIQSVVAAATEQEVSFRRVYQPHKCRVALPSQIGVARQPEILKAPCIPHVNLVDESACSTHIKLEGGPVLNLDGATVRIHGDVAGHAERRVAQNKQGIARIESQSANYAVIARADDVRVIDLVPLVPRMTVGCRTVLGSKGATTSGRQNLKSGKYQPGSIPGPVQFRSPTDPFTPRL